MDEIIKKLTMPPSWQIEVLNIVTSLDERVRVAKEKERLDVTLASLAVPKEDETIKAGEKLRSMLAVWGAATEQEKAKMLSIMVESVYCDTTLKKIVALKPRGPFLPLFALCEGLKEKDRLVLVPELVGCGDPEGI